MCTRLAPLSPAQGLGLGLPVEGLQSYKGTELTVSMHPRLKENPKEWVKFTAVMALLVCLLSFLLYRPGFPIVLGISLAVLTVCALRPRWFRGFYRGGMTVSFHVGQVIGRILLTLLFLLVVTPMGLLLRLFGKDLLQLKRPANANTYWRQAKTANQFDRMF